MASWCIFSNTPLTIEQVCMTKEQIFLYVKFDGFISWKLLNILKLRKNLLLQMFCLIFISNRRSVANKAPIKVMLLCYRKVLTWIDPVSWSLHSLIWRKPRKKSPNVVEFVETSMAINVKQRNSLKWYPE